MADYSTYNTKSGGKVVVKNTDQSLSDKDFAKESNRVGNQIQKVMTSNRPDYDYDGMVDTSNHKLAK